MAQTSHHRISPECLIASLLANIDSRALSDAEFREFVRIGLRQVRGGLPSLHPHLEQACEQQTQASLAPLTQETA